MVRGLTTVVIPTHGPGPFLADAVASALAQTAPVEVVVVGDTSPDCVIPDQPGRVVVDRVDSTHPSPKRNRGIDLARGEFLMFLDNDDTIEPTKVEEQIRAFDDAVGWVMCDVQIVDAVRSRTELASERYRYHDRQLGGWVREQLAPANFIPIMAPLIRRSVLTPDIRFGDLLPEDWHFWYRLASHARMRYLPKVLATYKKRRDGRNASRRGVAHVSPQSVDGPLILNLGCGTPGALSWHPQPGCINLDRSMGWCFEDGLPQYADGTVAGITISHTLMYVDARDWPFVFSEFARVLAPGGVVRITEDDTEHPQSSRLGGWKGSEPAVTLTSAAMVKRALADSGVIPVDVTADSTSFRDKTLMQAQHGTVPDVFFVEGIKPSAVLFSPHADDETLFASAAVMTDHPRVVICFPSTRDYGETEARAAESREAVAILGGCGVEQWDGVSLAERMRAYDAKWSPSTVWAPHAKASHPDHIAVSAAAVDVFGSRVKFFHTYDHRGKVRIGTPAVTPDGWIERKLRALACYRSQMAHPRASQFFAADLFEYVEA